MTDNDDNAGMTSAQSPEAIGVHTSGPWTATFSFPGLTPGIGDTWQIDCEGHAVCTTQFCYAPNTEANARLIAAAPDLLAVAVAIAPYLGATDANDWCGLKDDDAISMPVKMRVGDLRALKAAITKATAA